MTGSYRQVWQVDEARFPVRGTDGERLRFVLGYAILAPSGHNGQPWSFEIDGDVLRVRADRSRALPEVDPADRELLISCAATVHITRVALRHFGYRPHVAVLPDPADPDLVATVRLGAGGAPAPERDLFDAISVRHCNRSPYRLAPVPPVEPLAAAVKAEGAWLEPVADRRRIAAVADLIAAGDRIKWRDRRFRAELAQRLIPNRGRRRDGMPGSAFGVPGPLAHLAPAVVRRLDLGRLRAAGDRRLASASPLLVVVGTDRDEPPDWVVAGQAMSHLLLRATAAGLATSFLSQPIEVPDLRPRLAGLLGRPGFPQLLVRVGHPQGRSRLAPRRPVDEVLAHAVGGNGPMAARDGTFVPGIYP